MHKTLNVFLYFFVISACCLPFAIILLYKYLKRPTFISSCNYSLSVSFRSRKNMLTKGQNRDKKIDQLTREYTPSLKIYRSLRNQIKFKYFEILPKHMTVINSDILKSCIFRDIIFYSSMKVNRCFTRIFCLHKVCCLLNAGVLIN
jgi:hypothetical protein